MCGKVRAKKDLLMASIILYILCLYKLGFVPKYANEYMPFPGNKLPPTSHAHPKYHRSSHFTSPHSLLASHDLVASVPDG